MNGKLLLSGSSTICDTFLFPYRHTPFQTNRHTLVRVLVFSKFNQNRSFIVSQRRRNLQGQVEFPRRLSFEPSKDAFPHQNVASEQLRVPKHQPLSVTDLQYFDSLPRWCCLHLDPCRLQIYRFICDIYSLPQHPPGDDQYGYEDSGERWLPVHTVESIVSSLSVHASPP